MSKTKKISICSIISIILAVIVETVLIGNIQISMKFISRILIITGLIIFIGLHFIFGVKKIYDYIVQNRFKISGIMIIISAILGFFSSDLGLQDWIVNTEQPLTLWWNIKFYGLLLASYELFLIITNKNKNLSTIGAIVLAFSGCVQWNFTKIDSLIFGEIIVVLLNTILQNDSKNKKELLLYILGIVIFSFAYTYTFRPFAICFGYVFISLIIWILLKNKNKLKEKAKILLLAFIGSVIAILIGALVLPNIYTENLEFEINGISGLFSYLYTCALPYTEFEGTELLASFIAIYPIPMIISLYYLYKNEKHIEFLLPITIMAVLGSVFSLSGFPEVMQKVTMLDGINSVRMISAVQLANLFIIFYFLANVEDELFNIKYAMRITVAVVVFLVIVKFPVVYSTRLFLYLFVTELSMLGFLFINLSDKKYKKVFLFFLILITLIGGIPVNPII